MGTPRASVLGFSNPHGAIARALVINTPDIGAGCFREVAAAARAGGPPNPTKVWRSCGGSRRAWRSAFADVSRAAVPST
jgi:hypothetical protein